MNTSSRFKINVNDAKTLGGKDAKSYVVGRFTNENGKPAVVTIWSSGNPIRSSTIESGGAINGPQDVGAQMQTWQIRYGDSTSSQVATIWFAFVSGADKSCAASAQALAR